MAVGAFLFVVDFLLLVCVFDVLLLVQMARASDRRLAAPAPAPRRPPPPRAAIDAADDRFVRFLGADAAVTICGFLCFLVGLDLWVRARLSGADGNPAFLTGALVAVVLIVAGRTVARRRVWSSFGTSFPSVWESPTGLDRGRTVSTVDGYLDWRQAQGEGEGD